MKKNNMPKPKRITKATINRQQQIRNEVYCILKEQAHDWFSLIESRDNTLSKRLASIEAAGVPEGVLENIKKDISGIRYSMRNHTKAIENLLQFFNVSKELLNKQDE